VDSLVIQGVLTQELDFTATPLDYALFERSLGAARTMAWFPVIAKNAQNPYDPGPYAKPALAPVAPSAASTMSDPPAAASSPPTASSSPTAGSTARSAVTGP
jgi:penicillin amidase